jgi:hypothetical protein
VFGLSQACYYLGAPVSMTVVAPLSSPPKDLPMTKLITALRRALGEDAYQEPTPHFHQGTTDDSPEVCYESACSRPHLATA